MKTFRLTWKLSQPKSSELDFNIHDLNFSTFETYTVTKAARKKHLWRFGMIGELNLVQSAVLGAGRNNPIKLTPLKSTLHVSLSDCNLGSADHTQQSSCRQHLLPGKTFEGGSFLAADKPRDPRSGSVKPGERLLRRSCTRSAFLCTPCSTQLMSDWRSFSTSLSKKKGKLLFQRLIKSYVPPLHST